MATAIPEKIREAIQWAWEHSQTDNPSLRHEEGGYIVVEEDGTLGVRWWRSGTRSSIIPPKRAGDGSYAGRQVVGEFHTHPNPPKDEQGRAWSQAPSPLDADGIREENYAGMSYVITDQHIWQISPDGRVERVGSRRRLLQSAKSKE